MLNLLIYFEKLKLDFNKIGLLSFRTGIFLLPSAPVFGCLLLLKSALISSIKKRDKFFKDKWNYPLIIATILMVSSCISTSFVFVDSNPEGWDSKLSWLGLGNWQRSGAIGFKRG